MRAGGTSLDIRRAELAPDLELRQTPAPHAHWMEREIVEQPAAIARALAYGGRLGEDRVFLGGLDRRRAVHKSNCRDASPPRLNHDLHAIDATPARWRAPGGL